METPLSSNNSCSGFTDLDLQRRAEDGDRRAGEGRVSKERGEGAGKEGRVNTFSRS
jgi:hypothetical protein